MAQKFFARIHNYHLLYVCFALQKISNFEKLIFLANLKHCENVTKFEKTTFLTFEQHRQNKWKFSFKFFVSFSDNFGSYLSHKLFPMFSRYSNFRQFWGSKPGLIERIQVLWKEKTKQAGHCQSRLQTSREVLTKSATTVLCLSKNHKNSINLSLQDWKSRIKQDQIGWINRHLMILQITKNITRWEVV